MKPLALALALSLAAGTASAWPATNLSWDHCAGDGYVGRKTFDCASNTGEDLIVASWVPDRDDATVTAFSSVLSLTSTTPALSDWWKFGTGGCRAFLASVTLTPVVPSSNCTPLMPDGLSILGQFGGTVSGVRLGIAEAVPQDSPVSVSAGTEYELFVLHLPHLKSTGASACAGCSVPTCLAVPYSELDRADGSATLIPPGGATTITWQPGAYVSSFQPATRLGIANSGFGVDCSTDATPATNRTWGAIKSLYR